MPSENDFVTRAELKAHIDPMKDDIHEIHTDVKTLLLAHAGEVAVEARVKDTGARRMALAMLILYLVSATIGVAAYLHSI